MAITSMVLVSGHRPRGWPALAREPWRLAGCRSGSDQGSGWRTPPGGRRCVLGVGRPGWVEDGFDLEEDLDTVADDHPAAVHGDVGADAEVAPVELGSGREASPGAAVGVTGEAVDVQGQGDRPGHPVQGQLAVDIEAILAVADAGGAEGHRRIDVGLAKKLAERR